MKRSRNTRSRSRCRCGRPVGAENDLLDRLAADPRLGVTRAELDAAIADPIELAGTAGRQVVVLAAQIEAIAEAHPEAAGVSPRPGALTTAAEDAKSPSPDWRERIQKAPQPQ